MKGIEKKKESFEQNTKIIEKVRRNRTESRSDSVDTIVKNRKRKGTCQKWRKYTIEFCNSSTFKCDEGNGTTFKALVRL